MAGHAVKHAMERAAVDPAEVDDVIIGAGLPEGATGNNIGRTAALRAGCPVSVAGQTVSRYCASGLDAIASAAKRVMADGAGVIVAGGVESVSMVQNHLNMAFYTEEWLLRHAPDVYMPMLYTADNVAKKYGVSRERQDEYALQSQQRTAAAQTGGRVRRGNRAAAVVEVRAAERDRRGERGARRARERRRQSSGNDARGAAKASRCGSGDQRYDGHRGQ